MEDDILLHPQLVGQRLQRQPIGFALVANHVGVRGAHHQEHRGGEVLEHFGQGPNDVFDAFVPSQQAEGQEDRPALHAEIVLVEVRIGEGDVVDAVRDQIDFVFRDPVQLAQKLLPLLAHHHDAVGTIEDFAQGFPLRGGGAIGDGVQGRHQRRAQIAQQREDVAPIRTAKNAELVLQADDVDLVDVQEIGRLGVGRQVVLAKLEADPGRILIALRPVVHRDGKTSCLGKLSGQRFAQVGGEGGNPALPRQVVSDDCNPFHGNLLSKASSASLSHSDRVLGKALGIRFFPNPREWLPEWRPTARHAPRNSGTMGAMPTLAVEHDLAAARRGRTVPRPRSSAAQASRARAPPRTGCCGLTRPRRRACPRTYRRRTNPSSRPDRPPPRRLPPCRPSRLACRRRYPSRPRSRYYRPDVARNNRCWAIASASLSRPDVRQGCGIVAHLEQEVVGSAAARHKCRRG